MIYLDSTSLKFSLDPKSKKVELLILDQTLLPHEEKWIKIERHTQLVEAIKSLRVRGAPLIGVAACLGLIQAATTTDKLDGIFQDLYTARPTAVNLMNNLDEVKSAVLPQLQFEILVEKVVQIFRQDVELCEKMSTHTAHLIQDGDSLITHCNTGGLATAGVGTALGGIIKAHQQGKRIHVFVDETRPLLQGGRLTTWELMKHKIPMTLISDNMAAHVLKTKKVNAAFVGADRIAANGDFANKIGTYSLAIACQFHHIPFYVVAPKTTVDINCANGNQIHIEERSATEVLSSWAPKNAPVFNPAFDVTPAELITGWVLDSGVFNLQQIRNGKLKEVMT